MWETESYKTHEDHMQLFEALKKSMNHDHSEELAQDLAEARKKNKKSHELPKTPHGSPPHHPPPPPLPAGPSGASRAPGASGSSQVPPPPPLPSSTNQESPHRPSISLTPVDLEMDADMALDEQAQLSNDEDIGSAHISKASALVSNYSPPPEDSLIVQTGDITIFMDWFCKKRGINELKLQDLEGLTFEIVKVFHPDMATGFKYKHDYTVIESPKAVIFRDKYEVQMMMRFNEIHKFSDGTLLQIDEALDYRVKEFRINRLNLGLNTRFWTSKDVNQCNAFMFAIHRRLRTRRIFRNLKSFIGGRVREGDYRLLRRTD
nr:hypothetical protein [Tanacetum cinerariifolium]